jgi:hypothetical protein
LIRRRLSEQCASASAEAVVRAGYEAVAVSKIFVGREMRRVAKLRLQNQQSE